MAVKHTIRSSKDIESLFRTGRKIITRSTIVLVGKADEQRDQFGRAAFIAGKRLGNAPYRNKAKRKLREAARIAGIPSQGLDIVLIAKKEAYFVKPDEIADDIKQIVARFAHLSGIQHEQRNR